MYFGSRAHCSGLMSRNICSAVPWMTRTGPSPTRASAGGGVASCGAPPRCPPPRGANGFGSAMRPLVRIASISRTDASVGVPPVSPVP